MTRNRFYRAIQALAGAVLLLASPGLAVDLSGNIILSGSQTDSDGVESDYQQQTYSLHLSQILTPFVSFDFSYNLRDLDSDSELADPFSSRSDVTGFNLRYGRQTFSAGLSLTGNRYRTSSGKQDFDSEAVRAGMSWRPTSGFTLSADFSDESNVADVAVFGRESHLGSYGATAAYTRRFWGATYGYGRLDVDSPDRLLSKQERHEVSLRGSRSIADNRLSLNFSSNLARLERRDEIVAGGELVSPVPARAGLYAVDTFPEIGELAPNPGLVDGNVTTPAPPGIDIGGAATFRNIGLDFAISTQATRLEVTVNALSGTEVVWQVYQSSDNLVWERVVGVTSEFDEALLRYTLRFPQTLSRYLKAVNTSPNSEPLVRVTELRALLDVESLESESESGVNTTRYRTDLGAQYRATERVTLVTNVGGSNDESLSAGLVRRDFQEFYAGARVSIDLPKDFSFRALYRIEDVEDRREPVLLRTLEAFVVNLGWSPLPTFEALLTAHRRDETEDGRPLQTNDSIGIEAFTQLLPDLRLTTEIRTSRLTDKITGLSRDTTVLQQRFDAQPAETWNIAGSVGYSLFDASEAFPLDSRLVVDLTSWWTPTRRLNLQGTSSLIRDDSGTFVQQSYNISYMLEKLRLSASAQQSESQGGLKTRLASTSASYRLNRSLRADVALSNSETSGGTGLTTDRTSLTSALRLTF